MYQAELTAGDLLDEGRVFAKPPHLLAKPLVLPLQVGYLLGEAYLLPAGQSRGEQTALTDQGIRHQRTRGEQQQIANGTPAGTPHPNRSGPSG